jgi:hypothetical protein
LCRVALYGRLQDKLPDDAVHGIARSFLWSLAVILSLELSGAKGAVHAERKFSCEALPCDLIGIDKELMMKYIEHATDRLLIALGHSKLFKAPNPSEWHATDRVHECPCSPVAAAWSAASLEGPFDDEVFIDWPLGGGKPCGSSASLHGCCNPLCCAVFRCGFLMCSAVPCYVVLF